MATLRDSNNPVRIFMRRLGTLFLLAVVVGMGSAVWNVYHKERDSRQLRMQTEIERTHLEQQKVQLESNIERLETARGKEEALREKYEYGRSGESLIIIVEPPAPEPIVEKNGFQKWVNKFLPFW